MRREPKHLRPYTLLQLFHVAAQYLYDTGSLRGFWEFVEQARPLGLVGQSDEQLRLEIESAYGYIEAQVDILRKQMKKEEMVERFSS